jgi:hypothetical protein
VPPLAFVLRRRARRTEARAVLAIAVAFALSVVAPALMLAVGPIVFGVPHVAAEMRYLVVRRRVGRGLTACIVAGSMAIVAARLLAQLGGDPRVSTRLEVAIGFAWVLGGALLGARRAGTLRGLALLAPPFIGALWLSTVSATAVRLLFVHVHNFGALALWVVYFRRRSHAPWVALGFVGAGAVLLLSGVTIPWSTATGGLSALDVDASRVAGWLTPGLATSMALPLVLVHAFSDSVHYATWLAIIPDEDVRAEGSLTFRMSARSLLADFGKLGVALSAGALALVLVGAAVRLAATRGIYFAVVGFHGYVELGALAYFVAVGRRPGSQGAVTS